jgi:predicted nucleotidyltransferase
LSESIRRLKLAAEALPSLVNRLVFVGGGVTELLLTDAAGRKPRATNDLDCIIEVASGVNYHSVEKILRESGFSHDRGDPPVICRWVKDELILDVMPTIGGIVGPSNIWYPDAIANPLRYDLGTQLSVNIINSLYSTATKTEAFIDRGNSDYRGSRDFEDIVALINGRAELTAEMRAAKKDVREAMRDFWVPRLKTIDVEAAIHEHVDGYEDDRRGPMVLELFQAMLT